MNCTFRNNGIIIPASIFFALIYIRLHKLTIKLQKSLLKFADTKVSVVHCTINRFDGLTMKRIGDVRQTEKNYVTAEDQSL